MSDNSSSNKRIAKNTIYMYIRTLIMMLVSLYTSRVILSSLGQEDFGTYNIVGGVVLLFTFVSNAMGTGTQRHLSYELGKEDGNIPKVFSACLRIHICLALIVIVLAETIGLWFLNSKMNFPEGRLYAVNWVYHISVLTCAIGVIRVPYNAAIISHEKMSFYAYTSIISALLQLAVAFVISTALFDKLIFYAFLILVVNLIIFIWYVLYCHLKLPTIKITKVKDSNLYKYILSFSGWTLFGALSNVGFQQGVNIVINLFFGVTLNAAVGIANQVNSALSAFVSNFQQALNPQLVQAEAKKDRIRQFDLVFKSSRFSYYIMMLLSFPIITNIHNILRIWLVEYPVHTAEICVITMVGILISCLSGPLWVTIFATGKIKSYQVTVSLTALSVIPCIYVGGKFGMTPEWMFIIRSLNYIAVLVLQLYYIKKYISLSIFSFIKKVILPVSVITAIAILFYFLIDPLISINSSLWSIICKLFIDTLFIMVVIWFFGLQKRERANLKRIVKNKFLSKMESKAL